MCGERMCQCVSAKFSCAEKVCAKCVGANRIAHLVTTLIYSVRNLLSNVLRHSQVFAKHEKTGVSLKFRYLKIQNWHPLKVITTSARSGLHFDYCAEFACAVCACVGYA